MRRAEIIERLEKAEEPDRELDADIDVFLFGGETVWKQANYTMEMYPASRRASKNHVGGFAHEHVPLFTASLDSAIALVERTLPGWARYIEHIDGIETRPHVCQAELWLPAQKTQGLRCERIRVGAATEPIALLLALFRALEAKETGNG